MVIRLMSHRQPLALQFVSALAVDLQAAVDLIGLAVVLKNSAHVMQHPHDGFAHRGGHGDPLPPVRSLSADWGDLTTERKPVHLQPQAVWYP